MFGSAGDVVRWAQQLRQRGNMPETTEEEKRGRGQDLPEITGMFRNKPAVSEMTNEQGPCMPQGDTLSPEQTRMRRAQRDLADVQAVRHFRQQQ